jgi:uncharacterized protein (DUF1697 family)
MNTHIALLRGVNVGGHQKVAMADLRGLVANLGFAEVRSLLHSGNLVFRSDGPSSRGASAEIERLLQAELKKRLGIDTDFFVRSAAEWKAVIAKNPFREEAERDPARLAAMFLKDAPTAKQVAALEQAIVGRERFRVEGRLAYIVYPDGTGNSKLTSALIDRKLETRGTGRNWNTVLKLAAMSEE